MAKLRDKDEIQRIKDVDSNQCLKGVKRKALLYFDKIRVYRDRTVARKTRALRENRVMR